MLRALVIALAIVTVQWVLINRFPDPRWVLVTLAVPALFIGLTVSGVNALVGRRRGGARR
jgi:hypothetical protein